MQLALEHFQQAVDLDPGYSLAHVGIADTLIKITPRRSEFFCHFSES